MARLWTSGAEWNDATAEAAAFGTISGTTTFSTANPRSGTQHFRQTANASSVITWTNVGVLGTTYFLRAYCYVSALPAADLILLTFRETGTSIGRQRITLKTDGTLTVAFGASTVATSSVIAAGSYFMAELGASIGTGATDYVEGRLNGVSFGGTSTGNTGDTQFGSHAFNVGDGTITADQDDLALNDSTGASQTSWPDSGKIVLLKPISDNAVGAGWVNDANSATNIWTAVSNTPPKGTVNSTTTGGTHQIADATTGAVEAYDANLTTYTTAGVGASDTINFAQPFVATGAPVSTSAKTGALGVVSNPVIGTVNFADGGAVDAFWSGVTASAYPTGWKWSPGGTVINPSVTLGTSPVMRVVQIDSSTRVAMVCAMGMYVDYTPAAATAVYQPTLTMAPPIPSRRS